jgi:hypothetical protein
MDFVNLLHTLEDALYEVVMWVILLPKTLVRVLARPGWIQPYVTAEWEKKAEQRFQGYLSPMLFWVILGILPYAVWNTNFNVETGANPTYVGPVESTFLLNAFALIIFPTYYAIVLQRLRREPIEKDAIKRLFYIECYVHAPIALLGAPLALLFLNWAAEFISSTSAAVPGNSNLLLAYLGLIGLWVVLVESVIMRAELKTSWPRAVWLSLVYSLTGFVLMLLFLVVFSVLALLL